MSTGSNHEYELYYWSGIPGRGELIRLVLEEAGASYLDFAKTEEGDKALLTVLKDEAAPSFAAPLLRHGKLLLGQTALICRYLAERHGLTPTAAEHRYRADQLQLTLEDL